MIKQGGPFCCSPGAIPQGKSPILAFSVMPGLFPSIWRWPLLLTFMSLCAAVNAASEGDFSYSTDGTSVTITGYACPPGAAAIPNTIAGLPVTAIGSQAFAGCSNLTSITMPVTVTNIGAWAFYACAGLTNATIGSGVTSVDSHAFFECTALQAIAIPDSVANVWDTAFAACSNLTTISIGSGLTNLGPSSFGDCPSLSSVIVSQDNPAFSSLDGSLFNRTKDTLLGCTANGSYVIPSTVITIQDGAFLNRVGLINVIIPDSVARIGVMAFNGCTGLLSLVLPDHLTDIAGGAFAGCTRLPSVAIPDSVVNLGYLAFASWTALTNAAIGKGVTNIAGALFYQSSNLINIIVDPLNQAYISSSGVLFDKTQQVLLECPAGKSGSYIVPDGVSVVGDSAFSGCAGLQEVVLPNSVTNIGGAAFAGCIGLTGVFFAGNAPPQAYPPMFDSPMRVTVYRHPGTTGWSPYFAGAPTRLWDSSIQTASPGFGMGPHGFGFTIIGTTDLPVVVEASTGLANPSWVPLQTNSLGAGSIQVSDLDWANHSARFYRVRSR